MNAGTPSTPPTAEDEGRSLVARAIVLSAAWRLAEAAGSEGAAAGKPGLMLAAYLINLDRTTGLPLSALVRHQLPIWLAAGLMIGLLVRGTVRELLTHLSLRRIDPAPGTS